VTFIADEWITSQEELRSDLGEVKTLLGLNRFALVDEDNIVYTQYTTYTGRSRHTFLSEKKLNGRTITTVSIYGSSKQLCLAIPTPNLVLMGKTFKACFVQLDINEIVDIPAFDDQGKTHFAIYTKNGGNLSGTELGPVILKSNFFDALRSIVPERVLQENLANFDNETGGGITFDSVLALATVLLLQFTRFSREKLEEEKETSRSFRHMANTDALTGVRNKHAYTENETIINEQIKAGELQELGIVVGDINGLKYVNDTQGHAAGDRLIKDACSLICEYFKQGAVFRIGGDEFAVILQGKGFESMMEVMDDLNRKVEENIKEHAVVVSIGYSVLNPEDHKLRDVFERADSMMYERKRELKAMGAKTREDN
ncbi:MAG: GGDEF domain-containing protein, partial [Lachnospiraceae bacterium]|nr:GGDEF domain-containing protein [Lachnospiraceae bacterium]